MSHTIEDVKKIFEQHGYVCLADEWLSGYGATWKPLPAKCVCGKVTELSLSAVKDGRKCSDCQYEQVGKSKGFVGRMKMTDEQAKKIFQDGGCELLEGYKGCQTPMLYRCECGNISKIRIDHFRNGCRCSKCKRGIKTSIDEVRKIFADNQCELLEEAYTSPKQKIKYKCKCGKISYCVLSQMKFLKTHCKECGYLKNTGENASCFRKDREEYKEELSFKKKCYSMIYAVLKYTKESKIDHSYEILGYTSEQFKQHIESHPNWPKVCNKKWHVDHIFPIAAFIEHGIKDIKLINCIENLQPLCAKENSKKNKSYNKNEFLKWLKNKGIEIASENKSS
jgi:hypothetical protein